jgi:hypothetical protein
MNSVDWLVEAWMDADCTIDLLLRLSGKFPANQPTLFALLCKLVGTHLIFRMRKWAVRLFKLDLRRSFE